MKFVGQWLFLDLLIQIILFIWLGFRPLLEYNVKKVFQSAANVAILGNMLTTGVKIDDDLKMLNELCYEIKY